MIFSSGALLKHKDGAFIDTFDQVLRINHIPTAGFEDYVGAKTTVRFVHLIIAGQTRTLPPFPTRTPRMTLAFWCCTVELVERYVFPKSLAKVCGLLRGKIAA